jgi:glycosyltransferase involved in cell wall biosynthesis
MPLSPLKILLVGPQPPRRGGTAPSLMQLSVALQQIGHDMHVLAPITAETRDFDASFIPTLSGVRLSRYVVPYFMNDFSAVPYDENYRRHEHSAIERALPPLIDAERPDLIVAGQEPLAWIVPDIAKRYRLPCVLLLRGGPTWKIVTGAFPVSLGREWLEAFGRADRIVAVAHYFATGLQCLGLENVCAIPNHVDLRRFCPTPRCPELLRELDLNSADIIVLHASKLERRKRPLDIVSAAAAALQERPELVFIIIGNGPLLDDMKQACDSQAGVT